MNASRDEPCLSRVAAMIADPARSRMLAYLLDGHRASAGELASAAGVGAPTASAHLAKLVRAGLLVAEPRGRHRWFRIADAEVAYALEALALVADRRAHDRRWATPRLAPLRRARRCYGHLAGEVGVALLARMLTEGWLTIDAAGYALTDGGSRWLHSIGIEPDALSRRPRFAYPCMDWSERRDHLAGTLGNAILEHALARRWLRARTAARAADGMRDRALLLTAEGARVLVPALGRPSRTTIDHGRQS